MRGFEGWAVGGGRCVVGGVNTLGSGFWRQPAGGPTLCSALLSGPHQVPPLVMLLAKIEQASHFVLFC